MYVSVNHSGISKDKVTLIPYLQGCQAFKMQTQEIWQKFERSNAKDIHSKENAAYM